jgi:hypothetical protein
MPSASGMSAEADIFRVCHLLRRSDRYYLAGVSLVSACLKTTGGLSRASVVTAQKRIPFRRLSEAFRCA